MDYAVPNGDAIRFEIGGGYAPPDGGAIAFGLGSGDTPGPALRPLRPAGTVISWGRLRAVDGGCRISWRSLAHRDRAVRLFMAPLPAVPAAAVRIPWCGTRVLDAAAARLTWAPLDMRQRTVRLPWINPDPHCRHYRLAWGHGLPHDRQVRIPYIAGRHHLDYSCVIPWGQLPALDASIRIPWWAAKPHRDFIHRSWWGRELYERICRRAYEPPAGDAVVLDIDTLLSHVGDGEHIDFWFELLSYDLRCTQREPSGWRDNYLFQPPKAWPKAPKLEVWIVINTALLTRVLDGKPVEAHRMELSADIDSWCWSFSARVPAASLELVMPLDTPVAVDATINGYTWRVLIESWSESHSFARREYTIRGRSLSAYLTEPYAPARAGSNTQVSNARQLAEAELTNTGWAIDWGLVDWLVGTGALSYSNSTPLKVIQRIAETCGGRIISHRSAKRLIALPRLHSLPWAWPTATPALGISDYVVRQLSREFVPNVSVNAVFVSGESQGVMCKVLRRGTAGNELAPMVTDALITAEEPARERGRMIIGQSGKWSKEQLELPLTRPGDLPGLLEIGQLISMDERGQTWRGQVVGVRVSADFGGGFRVGQNIDVERYRGN